MYHDLESKEKLIRGYHKWKSWLTERINFKHDASLIHDEVHVVSKHLGLYQNGAIYLGSRYLRYNQRDDLR